MSVEGKLISQLPSKEVLDGTEIFVIEDAEGNKQVAASVIASGSGIVDAKLNTASNNPIANSAVAKEFNKTADIILDWNTDVATTRKQVPLDKRKQGLKINYKNTTDKSPIVEQYIGTAFDDNSWASDNNWDKIIKSSDNKVNENLTNLAKDFPTSNGLLSEAALKVPKDRRGIGTLLSDNIAERTVIMLSNNPLDKCNNNCVITLRVDSVDYPINVEKNELIPSIYQKIAALEIPNWSIETPDDHSLQLTKNNVGKGTLEFIYKTTPTYFIADIQITSTVENFESGNITFTVGSKTLKVAVENGDDISIIVKKIMSTYSSFFFVNLGFEQISDDTIRFTNYDTSTTSDKNISVSEGIIITSITTVQEFDYGIPNIKIGKTVINEGDSIKSSRIYQQKVSGDTDEIVQSEDSFSRIINKDDLNDNNFEFYSLINDDISNVPSDKRLRRSLRIGQDGSNNAYLKQFIGTEKSQYSSDVYWRYIDKNIKVLEFTGGIVEWTPIKDSYGNYVFGYKWQLNVIKEITTNNVENINTDGSIKSAYKITIPVGIYEIDVSSSYGGIFYNVKTKKFEFSISDYSSCYLFCTISEKYRNLVNIKKFKGVLLLKQFAYSGIKIVDISKGVTNYINVRDFLPDDISNVDVYSYIGNAFQNIKTWYFPKNEYKLSGFWLESPSSDYSNYTGFEIIGDGIDKTIFRLWDFEQNSDKVNISSNYFHDVNYRNFTIINRGFEQYGGTNRDAKNEKTIFENIKIEFTKSASGGYIIYVTSDNFNLSLKNVEIAVNDDDVKVFSGIWLASSVNVEIDNVKIGKNITKPFVGQGISSAYIRRLHTINGQTGIFFGAQKNRPLDGLVVENCIAEGASEECLSFDTYGNNVGLNPVIAELSIKEGVIETVGDSSYYNNRLKIYCDARKITGSHPNEVYTAYNFTGNEDYLSQFYVYFSGLAGDTFAGTVAKIIEVGEDAEKGQYLILNTQLAPEKLILLEDTNLDTSNNSNYQVASIMSGFFNCTIRNNIVRRGRATGLAMYQSFFNSVVEGNKIQNCRGGSYLYAGRVLAKPTWNGACGNIIKDNIFEGGEGEAFKFVKYGSIKGYNNIFTNNIILNSKGLSIKDEENLVFENNSIVGEDSVLTLSGTNNTSSFGEKLPIAPYPGQEFFDTTTSTKKRWNGSEWIEV